MSCSITLAGLAKDCTPSLGGIVDVLLADRSKVNQPTVTDGKISSITPVTASAKPFYRYSFRSGTCSLTSEGQIDAANGVNYVKSTLAMIFGKMETVKRSEVSALAQGGTCALVKDANGKWWYLGFDDEMLPAAYAGQTGTAKSDANNYTLSLEDNSQELPYEVNAGSGASQVDIESLVYTSE